MSFFGWLVHRRTFGVIIIGEGTSNNGNHFLNKISRIGLE
jgi:hypothetical protein